MTTRRLECLPSVAAVDRAAQFARMVKECPVKPEGEYALSINVLPNRTILEIRGVESLSTTFANVMVAPGEVLRQADVITMVSLYNSRRKADMSKDPIKPPNLTKAISPELSRKLQDWVGGGPLNNGPAADAIRHAEKQQEVEQAFSSLDKQVGGDHYKRLALQPWEIIDALDLDFYDGNALKYLLRWRTKGGVEDLKKAVHYIEHQIEKQEKRNVSK